MKRALITGAGGQDGYFLVNHLKSLGYEVWAGARHECQYLRNTQQINWIYLDLRDFQSIQVAIRKSDPDEIYNLGAQSFVPPSWNRPDGTFDVNVGGLSRILEFVDQYNKKIRIYQASSSEMFGSKEGQSNEETLMNPTSPYGVSKLASHHLCSVYRQKGMYIVSGILFNHESEYRGAEMVTRKITKQVAKWTYDGSSKHPLLLGSTDTFRDWGYAGDYVQAMHLMLQQDKPDDYVIATGETHSVQEFLETACEIANVTPNIQIDERFIRHGEIKKHWGDMTKARNILKFTPTTSFRELIKIMVRADIALETGEIK